jgi:hypothetical protein
LISGSAKSLRFPLGDWQDRPVLRVFTVGPINRFKEDRNEALTAPGAGAKNDGEVRLINEPQFDDQ